MKLSVTVKLFLTILAVTLIVALTMGLATHYNFSYGFIAYVTDRENKSFESLRNALAEAYQENGNWDFIRNDRRIWRMLRHESRGDNPPPTGPLVLYDADKQQISGGPRDLINSVPPDPITIDGAVVGYLVKAPLQNYFTQSDQRFGASQYRALLLTVCLSILITAVVAVFLTRILLAPIKKVGAASRRLAAGDYSTHVDIGSRDEVGQLAQDFNHLARTLARNEESRREFMADIAHELRTPLAILKGELEAMADGVRSLTPAAIQSLEAEVATLNKLVGDLWQLSQADIGALSYRKTTIDLASIIGRAVAVYRDRFEQQQITVHNNVTTELIFFGDAERLNQLFTNLLENTLRYTDPGGQLQIDARCEAHAIKLDFQDSEPGVPEQALPRLFERLYRVENSRNRASGGSGLGLSIAARIVEAHEGTICANASRLGGVHIAITLPQQATP